jgi:hypothetical protein
MNKKSAFIAEVYLPRKMDLEVKNNYINVVLVESNLLEENG